jgi:hypothetical protein
MSFQSVTPTKDAWLESLQDSGYRLTAPRRAIVTIIASSSRALEAIKVIAIRPGAAGAPSGWMQYVPESPPGS